MPELWVCTAETASSRRSSFASEARIPPWQTRCPHATSYGLGWPFTHKSREKKPAASSRRRSHADVISFSRPALSIVWRWGMASR